MPPQNSELARALSELERRKKDDPLRFYEPSSPQALEFHKSKAITRALFGANRSGKTETCCFELVFHLDGKHPFQEVPKAPVYWRYVAVDYQELEKVSIPKLKQIIPKRLLINGKWENSYNERKHILKLANGSMVDFMTHEQSLLSFEGAARHGTVFDEEPPYDIYKSCVLRHVDYNGRTIMGMTPLFGLTWVYDNIYLPSMTQSHIDSWIISIYDNKFLSAEAIAEVEKLITDETEREIRLLGKFTSRTGLVFKSFDATKHIYAAPTKEEDSYYQWWEGPYPPSYWIWIVGIDPGWGHPTGIVWLAINPDNGDTYVVKEHKASEMFPKDHADIIHMTNEELGGIKPIYVIDSQAKAIEQSKGHSVWKEYAEYGIVCRLGTKKLVDGNRKIAELMKVTNGFTKLHISDECPELIAEIGKYQRKETNDNQERFVDKENDLIAALRYAVWESMRVDMDTYLENINRRGRTNSFNLQRNTLKTGY